MDIVKFPVAALASTVGQALVLMKNEGISGIAVQRGNFVNLIGYGDLIARSVSKRIQLANLDVTHIAPVIESRDAKRMKLHPAPTMQMDPSELRKIEDYLLDSGFAFAAFGSVRQYASVLSLHETNLNQFRLAPLECYCTNIHRPHPYNRNNHPAKCHQDGTVIICE